MSAAPVLVVVPDDDDLVERFLDYCRHRGFSDRTITQYQQVLRRFAREHHPLEATTDDVTAWLAQFPKAVTRSAYRNAVVSMFRWLVEDAELLDRNPASRSPRPKVPQGQPRPIDPVVLEQAIATADPRLRCWLMLGALAGLRRSEITHVAAEDFGHGRLRVTGKGTKTRFLPVHPRLAATLDAYGMPATGRLWQVTPNYVGLVIRRHFQALGHQITAHQLRHSFATNFYRASGGDLLKLQRLMGHSSLQYLTVYAAFDDDLDDLVGRL